MRRRARLRYPEPGDLPSDQVPAGACSLHRARGGKLFADTAVIGVEEKDGSVVVKTEAGHTVRAKTAVVATNSPINDRVAIHSKQAPYRTYAMALALPRGALPDALYWDTLDPYHYVRIHPGKEHDHLIVGGDDHKTGEADDAEDRFEALGSVDPQAGARTRRVTHRWSGQMLDTIDYCVVQRAKPRQQERLCAHRQFRPGHHPWRRRQPDHRVHDHQGRRSLAGALRSRAQDRECDRHLHQREHDGGRRTSPSTSLPARCRPWTSSSAARAPSSARGLKKVAAYRDENGALHALRGVHASWLPSALELVRALLGLPLPRFAIRHRRRRTERAGDPSA